MRVLRPLAWVFAAGAALAVFVGAGRWSVSPLQWSDVGGWLESTSREDMVVELARWVGIVLAAYVLTVALLVVLAEVAATVRWLPVARVLRWVGSHAAVPVLRRRLMQATTATAFTVSSLAASSGHLAGATAPAPAAEVIDDAVDGAALPEGLAADAFAGFQLARRPAVSAPSNSVDTAPAVARSQRRAVDPAAASWAAHMVVEGDTLWEVLEARYGRVDADMVWQAAADNRLEDPASIPVGMVLHLRPIDAEPAVSGHGAGGVHRRIVVVVEPGDTLSELIARYGPFELSAEEIGRVVLKNHGTATPDGMFVFDASNPDLIHAGQEFDLSEDAAAPTPERRRHVDEPSAAPPAPAPEGPIERSPVPAPDLEPPPPRESRGTRPPPREVARSPREPSVTTSTAAAADGAGAMANDVSMWAFTPWVLGGGSLTLATGLLAAQRRRRRLRGAGERVWAAMADGRPLEDVADLGTVQWAAAALSRLMSRRDTAPIAVEVDGIQLCCYWAIAEPVAAPPWTVLDGGRVWRLARGDHVAPDENAAPLGLVTIGEREGRQLLVTLTGPLIVTGDGMDAAVRSMLVELSIDEVMASARVLLVDDDLFADLGGIDRVSADQAIAELTRVSWSGAYMIVVVVAGDHPRVEEIAARADPARSALLVLRGSDPGRRALAVDEHGRGTLTDLGFRFDAVQLSSAVPVEPDTDPAFPPAISPAAVTVNCADLRAPTAMLRLFSPRLPTLDPSPLSVSPAHVRLLAVLDSFAAGRSPRRLAERMNVKEKTVRTAATGLLNAEPPIIHSDGAVWSLDEQVMSDAAWLARVASFAAGVSSRVEATVALGEVWACLAEVTGPAYGGGGEMAQWDWAFSTEEGVSPAATAWARLSGAVATAVEVWDKHMVDGDDDQLPPARLVDLLLKVEQAVAEPEPWPLFEAAAVAARHAPHSALQRISVRLAQLAHAGSDVPAELVAQVAGDTSTEPS